MRHGGARIAPSQCRLACQQRGSQMTWRAGQDRLRLLQRHGGQAVFQVEPSRQHAALCASVTPVGVPRKD